MWNCAFTKKCDKWNSICTDTAIAVTSVTKQNRNRNLLYFADNLKIIFICLRWVLRLKKSSKSNSHLWMVMVIRGFLPLCLLLPVESFCLLEWLASVNLSRISMSTYIVSKVMCESTRIYAKYGHCCSLQEFHFSWYDWASRYEYRLTISSCYIVV